jgi:DNA-directed RNA polymerase subunit RPC12/RpoP
MAPEAGMSDDDVTLEMSMPLDSDGFLRRECPTCEREFKWFYTPEEEGTAALIIDGGYFCPYCGVQAETNTWLTQTQVEVAQNMVATQVLGAMLKKFGDDIKGIGRSSGGVMSAEVKYDAPDELDPLTEVDDMTRVDFECHPTEPVKVLDDWDKPVRCLMCGQPNS